MQGNSSVVVNPEDVLSIEIVAQRGQEAARRCGTLLGAHIRQLPVTDTAGMESSPRARPQQGWGCSTKLPIGIEYKNFGIHLVDNHKWHAVVVP